MELTSDFFKKELLENVVPFELQSDMKLWWVHCEAILAAWLVYKQSGDERFKIWFERLCEWSWPRFADPKYGEWFGYLDRRGEPALFLKGGKWKTFFHLPRMLLRVGNGVIQ